MKNLLKLTLILLILLLIMIFYAEGLAFPGAKNYVDFDAETVGNLKDSYRLYFFPLTPYETERFKSCIIEIAETDDKMYDSLLYIYTTKYLK